MTNYSEVRIKLPQNIHQKWQQAAAVRGLPLKAFISATISAELIRTGELQICPEDSTTAPPKVASTAKQAEGERFVPQVTDAGEVLNWRDEALFIEDI